MLKNHLESLRISWNVSRRLKHLSSEATHWGYQNRELIQGLWLRWGKVILKPPTSTALEVESLECTLDSAVGDTWTHVLHIAIVKYYALKQFFLAATLNMPMANCLTWIYNLLYHDLFQMWYIHHVIVQQCQTSHNNNLNHPIISMKPIFPARFNHILSLLDSGHSRYDIRSKNCPNVWPFSNIWFIIQY